VTREDNTNNNNNFITQFFYNTKSHKK